ncbi:MAG: TetR/AcrR family transcriptional regulator [Pseudomonadales bacterium]
MTNKQKTTTRAGRPKGSRKEDTLARILPVARRLFAEKGYARTTFKDVGDAIGTSHAALYTYFPSKAELYLAAVEDTQSLLFPRYLEAIEQGNNLRERLTRILMASAKAHDLDPSITGLLATIPIESRRHPELAELFDKHKLDTQSVLEQLFAEAKLNGEIRSKASPEDLVIAIMGAGVGIAMFQYGLQASTLTDAMEVFVDLIEGNLFN